MAIYGKVTEMLRAPTTWSKITAGELPFEIGIGLCGGITGVVTGIKFLRSNPPEIALAIASFVAAAGVVVLLFCRAIARNRKAQNSRELHALDGALHTVHAVLTENQAPHLPGHSLRVCVFVPGSSGDTVHQITDYVGVQEPYGRGRDLSSRCGVVGKAFRSGYAQFDKLPKGVHVTDHLVEAHGFDRTEASTMKRDRQSWAAVPIGEPGRVVAVIYLDSALPNFFGSGNQSRRKIIEAATIGVANFIVRS